MIIKGIAASLPSRQVSNEEVIDLIRHHSKAIFEGDLEHQLKIVLHLLKRTGLEERRWCNRHESPIDHVAMAVRKAFEQTYLRKEHIELLVYVGVGRGFLEPGNSHMIANALGFHHAQCFDIVDACMSWVRALELVDGLFKTGRYRNALVINAEFNTYKNGPLYPDNFALHNSEQITYTFPTFTIGEAATATLLTDDEPDNFKFHFTARPDLSELCTIPLHGYQRFCHPTDKIGKNGVLRFTSFGEALHKEGYNEITDIIKRTSKNTKSNTVFVHASSKKEWDTFGSVAGVQDMIHHVYPKTGNLVSASVPTAMHDAIEKGALKRGDKVTLWVGSAGMSFNTTHLTY